MSSSKALLKGINDAIKQQKYGEAIGMSRDFLKTEPKSYQWLVNLISPLGPYYLMHDQIAMVLIQV